MPHNQGREEFDKYAPKLPPGHVLLRLAERGLTDKQIAEMYGCSYQAVNKRLVKMGVRRRSWQAHKVAEWLRHRWEIRTAKGDNSHHNKGPIKELRALLRLRLGDETVGPQARHKAELFERRLKREGVVLCYDPDSPKGWYYRPRRPEDGRLMIDWPADLPFPDEKFQKILELSEDDFNRTL